MNIIVDALLVLVVSIVITGLIIPKILLISFRKKLFDEPDPRKIHHFAIPRLGGLAFLPAIILTVCLVGGFHLFLARDFPSLTVSLLPYAHDMGALAARFKAVLLPVCMVGASLMIMYLVGIADDLIGVRYRAKFVAQIAVGVLFVVGGVTVGNLGGMLGFFAIPDAASWLLTVFLVVFVMNAINLIDGIDGLASGLCAIATAFYGVVLMWQGQVFCSLISFASLGTLIPFYCFNVFGSAREGRKIFMGDTGALTTGTILVFLAIRVLQHPIPLFDDADPVVVAFSPLLVPCMDVVRVFWHRVRRGRSPFLPDKAHIHHKLLALGFPQRWAMLTILAVSCLFIAVNLLLVSFIGSFTLLLIDLLLYSAFNVTLTRCIRRRERRLHCETPLYE